MTREGGAIGRAVSCLLASAALLVLASCSSGAVGPGGPADAAAEAAAEAGIDVSQVEVGSQVDAPVRDAPAVTDATLTDRPTADVPPDVGDAMLDRGVDAPTADGGVDRAMTDASLDGAGADAGSPCPGSTIKCGVTCIDPTSDPTHCGATLGCGTNGGSGGVACTSGRVCSTLLFQSTSFATGTTPKAVVIADLNADGRADLAVASGVGVSVLLGNGDGSFQNAMTFPAGSAPLSIAAGDLDGDGKLDLVVANNLSNDVSALLGNGDGTFQTHKDFPVGSGPFELAVAELTGDGKLDVAVACGGSQDVYVLRGVGDGTFAADVQLPSSSPDPITVVGAGAADLNADGKIDLVMSNNRTLDLFFGNGDGSFQAPKEVYFSSGNALAFGDLDGDGKLDILAEMAGGAMLVSRDASGTFVEVLELQLGDTANSVAIADLNGDGKLDVAATTFYSVVIRLNNGDGTFKPPQSFSGGNVAASVAVGDFNSDGRPDLVITDSGANAVHVLLSSTTPPGCR